MTAAELHPLAAEVAVQLGGQTGPFLMLVGMQTHVGRSSDLVQAFLEPLAETVQEQGNFTYRLVQDLNQPEKFLVIEHWQDLAALDSHLKQPYLERLLQNLEPVLCEAPTVTVMREYFPTT